MSFSGINLIRKLSLISSKGGLNIYDSDFINKLQTVFCAIFRHSDILDDCFCYHYCARCDAQLGDSLMGAYQNNRAAYVYHLTHGCPDDVCEDNYKKLGFIDKFLVEKTWKKDWFFRSFNFGKLED